MNILSSTARMPETRIGLRSVAAVLCAAVLSGVEAHAQVNVTQEHNNPSRDGVYVDAAFTPSASANLTRDLNFNGTISGNDHAIAVNIPITPGRAAPREIHCVSSCTLQNRVSPKSDAKDASHSKNPAPANESSLFTP